MTWLLWLSVLVLLVVAVVGVIVVHRLLYLMGESLAILHGKDQEIRALKKTVRALQDQHHYDALHQQAWRWEPEAEETTCP